VNESNVDEAAVDEAAAVAVGGLKTEDQGSIIASRLVLPACLDGLKSARNRSDSRHGGDILSLRNCIG
jgi:hypothetical protein